MAGIYIHIPFCRQKCHYCNFYSVASKKLQQDFIPALLKEIELRKDYLEGEIVESIYFGGGTPSLMPPGETAEILDRLLSRFNIAENAEITLEANPDDVTFETASLWKNSGFNRISLGVQSFNDNDLAYLNRTHDGLKAQQAVELLKKAGINNISADLIYGIPTLSTQLWEKNLNIITNLGIPHLSAYWLTVEEGTALEKMIGRNRLPAPEDEPGLDHFKTLRQWAKNNDFVHYEISNFGKTGYFSRHNQNYWKGVRYLGLGPSAHSFNGHSRQWNINNLTLYKENLNQGIILAETESLTPLMHYEEMIMTGLRTIRGVDLLVIKQRFGECIQNKCRDATLLYLKNGFLSLENETLTLTEEGMLISDHIIADLFIEPEEWQVLTTNCRPSV